MTDYRRDANRIQMQLVRLMTNAQCWHDMEQITDAMFQVQLRADAMMREQNRPEGVMNRGGTLVSPLSEAYGPPAPRNTVPISKES